MIRLKQRTKHELQKMLNICIEIEELKNQLNKYKDNIDSLYVVDDQEAFLKYQEEMKIYEEKRAEIRKTFYSSIITKEEMDEIFNKLKDSKPQEPERYIPKTKMELFNELMDKNRNTYKALTSKEAEKKQQEAIIMETFIDEYGLSNNYAKIVDKAENESKKLYHNPSFRGKQRDLKETCKNMTEGKFHVGNFTLNQAGVALYFGDINHTKSFYFSEYAKPEEKPKQIIEANVKKDAKFYKISRNEYLNNPGEEYLPYFEKEDFDLLNNVQRKAIMHLRCIFDVAMGYDACVRVYNNNEVWAVYNRSIIELEKNPIKEFDSIFNEDLKQDE